MMNSDYHFVSPETKQHEPVPVDAKHANVTEAQCVPCETSIDQTTRKHEVGVVEKGAGANRVIKKTAVAERHVTSEPGMANAKRRSAHVKSVRAQREKENFGS